MPSEPTTTTLEASDPTRAGAAGRRSGAHRRRASETTPGEAVPAVTSADREDERPASGITAIWSEGWKPYRGVPQLTALADIGAFLVTAALLWPGPREILVLGVCALGVMLGGGALYRSRLTLSVLEDLPELAGRVLGAGALAAAILAFVGRSTGWTPGDHRVIGFTVTLFVLMLVGRIAAYSFIRWARARRRVGHRTVIIGAGKVGRQIATILREHPNYGLNVLGFLDDNPLEADDGEGPAVIGSQDNLEQTLADLDARMVVIAFTQSDAHLVETIRACDKLDIEVFIVPRLFELHQVEGDMDSVWGMPLVRLRRAAHRSWTWHVKRLMDIACSGFAVVVLSPIMALLALGVRLDGGPGIIFRQQRVGIDGEPVEVMKFRSMRPVNEAESQTNWNIANDNRLSKFGKFIRKTSLDELPQLFNILKGEMSIVGPRPERPFFVEQFKELYPSYSARHRVPCGLTGWAAVNGLRGDTSIEDRARFDNYYIQNWSLWLDVKIILRTVGAVFTGAGG